MTPVGACSPSACRDVVSFPLSASPEPSVVETVSAPAESAAMIFVSTSMLPERRSVSLMETITTSVALTPAALATAARNAACLAASNSALVYGSLTVIPTLKRVQLVDEGLDHLPASQSVQAAAPVCALYLPARQPAQEPPLGPV